MRDLLFLCLFVSARIHSLRLSCCRHAIVALFTAPSPRPPNAPVIPSERSDGLRDEGSAFSLPFRQCTDSQSAAQLLSSCHRRFVYRPLATISNPFVIPKRAVFSESRNLSSCAAFVTKVTPRPNEHPYKNGREEPFLRADVQQSRNPAPEGRHTVAQPVRAGNANGAKRLPLAVLGDPVRVAVKSSRE